jgi:2-isopropylmalate synthase
MTHNITILDTTLRDGEQSPGCSMTLSEKLEVAERLEALRVDVIEAGFAAASKGDFEAVRAVATKVKDASVAALARALPKDIEAAGEALRTARSPRIHTFIATSDIHMDHKLKKSRSEVLANVGQAVRLARSLCGDVEFSAEDATRTDPDFLVQVLEEAIRAGASVINVPDTVGYTTPGEFRDLIVRLREKVTGIDKVGLSVHCHNDLGMAVANTLAAALVGATQLECTINGIGERAGNAALEEIVMALHTRKALFDRTCRIDTTQIYRTCKLVSALIGRPIPANKAIVGANAFAHESGIHQHGVLSESTTYEIMTPQSIGLAENKLVLGKHSGRHAFEARVVKMGYNLTSDELNRAFERFKDLADRKKTVTELDLEAILQDGRMDVPPIFRLERFIINSGNTISATANVCMAREGKSREEVAVGDGPMDAAFNAVERIMGTSFQLEDYSVHSVGGGKDAQGEVVVKIRRDGRLATGRGLSTDVVEAGILAYINAANRMLAGLCPPTENEETP